MAKRRAKSWFQRLNSRQRKHLREMMGGTPSIKRFLEMRKMQIIHQDKSASEPCWECWGIERELVKMGKVDHVMTLEEARA